MAPTATQTLPLWLLGRVVWLERALLVERAGMTLTELRVLAMLGRAGISTQAEIASALDLDNGVVTRTAKALEQQGLVSRAPSPDDSRFMTMRPTDAGWTRYRSLLAAMEEHEQTLFDGVDPDDLRAARRVMDRLHANLQKVRS